MFPHCATANSGPRPPLYRDFVVILRHITLSGVVSPKQVALPDNKHHAQQTDIQPPARFGITASERLQTRPSDCATTGFGYQVYTAHKCLYLKTKDTEHFTVRTCWSLFTIFVLMNCRTQLICGRYNCM